MRSLRTQLLVSHLALVAVMGILLTGATASFFTLRRDVERILADNFPTVVLTGEIEANAERIRNAPDREVRVGILLDQLDKLAPLLTDADERERYRELRAAAQRVAKGGGGNDITAVRLAADAIREANARAVREENARTQDVATRFAYVGLGVTAIALLLALLLSLRLVRLALTPLAIIAKAAETIGTGHDLPERLEVPRRDEIGNLAESFNEMATRLADLRKQAGRRLERAQRLSDAAINSLYDPVIVVDAKQRIVNLNAAATDLFGPIPDSPRVALPDHVADDRIVRAIDDAVDEGRTMADEAALAQIRVGDAARTYRIRATPMRTDDGGLLGAVAVLEDVTYLRELDRMKTEFVGVAAHELRTPVASLLLSNDLLREGAVGELTPEMREVVEVQRDDLQRLEKLTRDLLDVTRLERGTFKLKRAPVSVRDLFKALDHDARPPADAKGVALTLAEAPDLALRIDRLQIGRVLLNLVNNAVRHTLPGGSVTVGAEASADRVSFWVKDTGEGIPAEYLEQIFERFVQVPDATQGGAGLGLSIARGIVKNHGGEMSVESELGKGSTFRFWLPLPPEVTA